MFTKKGFGALTMLGLMMAMENHSITPFERSQKREYECRPKRKCLTCEDYPNAKYCGKKGIRINENTPACSLYVVSRKWAEMAKEEELKRNNK